ncbi:MAG: ABC transporter permease [Eggerthella lenta]
MLQAAICCAGVLAIGVQAANAPALFFAAIVASLSYLSIIYALSVTLQHIGKGICIVLVFAQIPGATGLYPIEMTSSFFQAVYPFFPFTYGISAMREAIFGFYGSQYVDALGMLAHSSRCSWRSTSCGRSCERQPVACQVRKRIFNREDGDPRAPIVTSCSERVDRESIARHGAERFERWYRGSSAVRWPWGFRCPWRLRWCSRSRRPRRCSCSRRGWFGSSWCSCSSWW